MTDENRPSKALDDLRSLGRHLAGQVSPVEATSAAFRAMNVGRRRNASRVWTVALATLGVLVVSNVALAAASNSAVPGDLLYSLDRGYEWVADRISPQDHSAERLDEVEELVAQGDTDMALSLLTETLDSLSVDSTLTAAVAASVQGNGPANAVLKAAVEELVGATKLISEASKEGDLAGLHAAIDAAHARAEDVAEAAREQGGSPNSSSDSGNPSGQGNSTSPGVTAPGRIDDGEATTSTGGVGNGQSQGQGQGQTKQKSKEG
jgi:hypothetical protein